MDAHIHFLTIPNTFVVKKKITGKIVVRSCTDYVDLKPGTGANSANIYPKMRKSVLGITHDTV